MTFNKYLIYDLEIIKAIPPKDEADRLPEIEYCGGWDDFENMGIACISWAMVNMQTLELERSFSSLWENSPIFQLHPYLTGYDCCIGGFNSWKFDDELMKANYIDFRSHFDLLDLVLEAAGLNHTMYWQKGYKYSLAAIAATNGLAKTGTGENAPILYQKGMHTKLLNYCLNDSIVAAEILVKLLKGELIDPNTNELLYIDPKYLIEHI